MEYYSTIKRRLNMRSVWKIPAIVNITRMACMTSMQPGSQGEWTGMHKHEQWWLHCTSQWGQWVPLSEHVYCVAIPFKMTEWVEQWIHIKFYVKLEHSSKETISVDSEGHSYGQLLIGCFVMTMHLLMYHVSCRVFWQSIKLPRWLSPLLSRFGILSLLAFPQTKVTFERGEISDRQWDSGKYNRAVDGDWENCVRAQGAHFEGDWDVIVLCTMFLVSFQ